jgi:hypothetical protein
MNIIGLLILIFVLGLAWNIFKFLTSIALRIGLIIVVILLVMNLLNGDLLSLGTILNLI